MSESQSHFAQRVLRRQAWIRENWKDGKLQPARNRSIRDPDNPELDPFPFRNNYMTKMLTKKMNRRWEREDDFPWNLNDVKWNTDNECWLSSMKEKRKESTERIEKLERDLNEIAEESKNQSNRLRALENQVTF